LAIHAGEQKLLAGEPMKPIDTTGAGDAFVGGLLACLSSSEEWCNWTTITKAVGWANGCGALATTQKGAMTALPNKTRLLKFINS
jgi:fructokinase